MGLQTILPPLSHTPQKFPPPKISTSSSVYQLFILASPLVSYRRHLFIHNIQFKITYPRNGRTAVIAAINPVGNSTVLNGLPVVYA